MKGGENMAESSGKTGVPKLGKSKVSGKAKVVNVTIKKATKRVWQAVRERATRRRKNNA